MSKYRDRTGLSKQLVLRPSTAVLMIHVKDYCIRLPLPVFVSSEEDADTQIVLMKATKLLRSEFGFSSITIQVER